MNTLVVAPFLPYPLVFGGAIRLYHMLRMLSTFSDVSLLCYRSWDRDDPSERNPVQHTCPFCDVDAGGPPTLGCLRHRWRSSPPELERRGIRES